MDTATPCNTERLWFEITEDLGRLKRKLKLVPGRRWIWDLIIRLKTDVADIMANKFFDRRPKICGETRLQIDVAPKITTPKTLQIGPLHQLAPSSLASQRWIAIDHQPILSVHSACITQKSEISKSRFPKSLKPQIQIPNKMRAGIHTMPESQILGCNDKKYHNGCFETNTFPTLF